LIVEAIGAGYGLVSLETWLRAPEVAGERQLVMRHDVDQHPRSALTMAAIEARHGVLSTWYFRWRTAHAEVIARLREQGHAVGLHYETLSRTVLERDIVGEITPELVEECRGILRDEIAAFDERFGPIRSVCPHGDSRVPGVRNALLLKGQDWARYGVEHDGNEAMHGRRLAYWLTDRARAEGSWVDGVDPAALFSAGRTPILCVTHPNNWVSGSALWLDRIRRRLPASPAAVRTGADTPPLAS
jgi:hypothetical protein